MKETKKVTVFHSYERKNEWIKMIDGNGQIILYNPATGEKR